MLENRSPWLHQLDRKRDAVALHGDHAADVAIVGGGIAGVVTAYFTLRDTERSVALIEADKVAHGATGHNAGQITSYFERGFADIAREYGLELAADGQKSVEGAWELIDGIVSDAGLTTPVYRFTGYAGCSTLEQVLEHLENNRLRREGGLPNESVMLAQEWLEGVEIPAQYEGLYTTAPLAELTSLLETKDQAYIAVIAYQKGCTNSARFTEELAAHLLTTYPDRFTLYEQTPVTTVRLSDTRAVLETAADRVEARNVVLATNGFEHFTILNENGPDIDTSFHHDVMGRIGYMTGYLESAGAPPAAISYFPPVAQGSEDPTGEAYYYLTRRPHVGTGGEQLNLLCAGGPDAVLPNKALYEREGPGREDMQERIDEFLRTTYKPHPGDTVEYAFTWHGLMGFTPSGIRRVGFEPKNQTLLYNLGCNGVGILPSIYGGKRIARLLSGEELPPSIFDPRA